MTDHLNVQIVCLVLVAVWRTVEGNNVTSTTEADPCTECDPYSTSCYKYTSGTVSYSDAQTACESCGGYLVSINDEDEYQFITSTYSLGSVTFWIGLWRTSLSGEPTTNWEWQDGTQLNISKWFTEDGEPTGNSQCGLYTSNGFIDTQCGGKQNYICETPNPTTTTAPATTVSTTLTADSPGSRTGNDDVAVWIWILVTIVVVVIVAVTCVVVVLFIQHKKKMENTTAPPTTQLLSNLRRYFKFPGGTPIPSTPATSGKPSESEEPLNVDASIPPCSVKYRPNYESVVVEAEDKSKANNSFGKGPPGGTQAHGGGVEQGGPVVSPTDVYAEVRKKDSANGAEMVIVENTLYGAGDFKDE